MKLVLIRFLIVWLLLNIILLPIEWFRYKESNLSPYGFVNLRMWEFTAFVIGVDIVIIALAIVVPIMFWVLNPILN